MKLALWKIVAAWLVFKFIEQLVGVVLGYILLAPPALLLKEASAGGWAMALPGFGMIMLVIGPIASFIAFYFVLRFLEKMSVVTVRE